MRAESDVGSRRGVHLNSLGDPDEPSHLRPRIEEQREQNKRSMFVGMALGLPAKEVISGRVHDAHLQLQAGSKTPHLIRQTGRLLDEVGDRRLVGIALGSFVEVRLRLLAQRGIRQKVDAG